MIKFTLLKRKKVVKLLPFRSPQGVSQLRHYVSSDFCDSLGNHEYEMGEWYEN